MEMSKRGLDGKNMVSFIDELVSLKKNLELKFYDDVPEEILNKWKKIHELAKVKLNDQERKSKMNFGRRTNFIANAYHDFDIQLNRDQSISFKVSHDFNKYGSMNLIPNIDESDETKKRYYKNILIHISI